MIFMICKMMSSDRSSKKCKKSSNYLVLDDENIFCSANSISPKKTKKNIKLPVAKRTDAENADKLHAGADSKMDAFKLMMNSRNKVIGSNSPGKEVAEESESLEEKIVKANAKASIKLKLQAMADKKVAHKKKLTDEERDEQIKNALDKRAKRLKKMLMNKSTEQANTEKQDSDDEYLVKSLRTQNNDSDNGYTREKCEISTLLFVLNDVPNESSKVVEAQVKPENSLAKEDVMFLNCLSPSIKRKQSVLSYFNKIEKVPINVNDDKSTILNAKIAKRQEKNNLKLSLQRHKKASISESCNILHEPVIVVLDSESNLTDSSISESTGRPKRTIRRPVKYVSNSEDDSLSEEYHNDNKQKKRTKSSSGRARNELDKAARKTNLKESSKIPLQTIDLNSPDKTKTNLSIKERRTALGEDKKATVTTKLAPLFIVKPSIDPAVLAARKDFLHSSYPEQIKRLVEKPKSQIESTHESFFEVCHVQQIPNIGNVEYITLNLPVISPIESEEHLYLNHNCNILKTFCLGQFTQCKENKKDSTDKLKLYSEPVNLSQALKEMKCNYPEFPFYKVFRNLRDQYRSSSQLENSETDYLEVNDNLNINTSTSRVALWIEKYKPISTYDILGNRNNVKYIKEWLYTWKEYSEEFNKKTYGKTRIKKTSTSSDEFCLSDSESHDSTKQPNNVLVITGPQGCGKTSFIYATASELNINVLEINASSKRTGKRILTEMQEATKSHKVIRSQSYNADALSQHFSSVSQRDEDVFLNSQGHSNVQRMSMILVEDADVVFEQDDGFVAALAQIVQSSKRPVLLVTSDLTCAHMQRFITRNNVVKFSSPNPKVLGAWFEVICLLESGHLPKKFCQYLLEFNGGDVRRTMHQLQFLVVGSCLTSFNSGFDLQVFDRFQNEESLSTDDYSNSSWLDQWTDDANLKNNIHNLQITPLLRSFLDIRVFTFNQHTFIMPFTVNFQKIWWNVFPLLNEISSKTDDNKKQNRLEHFSMFFSNLSDIESMSKYTECKQSDEHLMKFWETLPIDSISEEENFTNYQWYQDVASSWSHFMLASSIQALSRNNFEFDISLPRLDKKRQHEEVLNTHRIVSEVVPQCCQLQRTALALDYLPALRTICRNEKDRESCNRKRRNRFSHYLKSTGTDCKEKDYNTLCNTLNNPTKL